MKEDFIIITGAKEHNLKNINLRLPKNKLIVFSGLSGSGKSSLAFDTLYAEGQRRYVESLSSYARQFLEKLQKPDVEHIEGISPAIAIEQRASVVSLRSIVGTQTEIYDYLRLLFARVGVPFCAECGQPISSQNIEDIINKILAFPEGRRLYILAPLVKGKKGSFAKLLARLRKEGFARVRLDGKIFHLEEEIKIDKNRMHNLEVVVDRLVLKKEDKARLRDSLELALKLGEGLVRIKIEEGEEYLFNTTLACPRCGRGLLEMEPRFFSFNSPYGACPVCKGLGIRLEFDEDLIVPDKTRSLAEGAIEPWRRGGRGYIMYYRSLLRRLAEKLGFSMDTPFNRLAAKVREVILYGTDVDVWGRKFEGVIPHLERLFNQTESDYLKAEISRFMSKKPCPACGGKRLRPESLAVYIEGKNIWDIMQMQIKEAARFFDNLSLDKVKMKLADYILREVRKKLSFCLKVGLGYLTLDRHSATLSGGEAQRIRLATQVGSSLAGILYILDEPTIGLHPRDNLRLIDTLKSLQEMGNTLVVVEHDEAVLDSADWVVDLGPGAGQKGGEVVFSGRRKDFLKSNTLTARYLRREIEVPLSLKRRSYKDKPSLLIEGGRVHNLKNIDVRIPLGVLVCITGVSGSGKSTLVEEVICKNLKQRARRSKNFFYNCRCIKGEENIREVIIVDQNPIGRTPRSNPATYTDAFAYIRDLFSRLPESRARGYGPGRFSFNVKGGRCEACRGEGTKRIEMHFLPDVYIKCEVCKGRRFNDSTLEIKFKGYSIADILDMSIEEAYKVFADIPAIENILTTLRSVGLGYLQLGQPATTLSGGEAQRIKLAKYLRQRQSTNNLYILDEPTVGLHFEDVKNLVGLLQRLVDKGNTVLVIEHNMDVVKNADYIIDLGPEGGNEGGNLVACGSVCEIIKNKHSYTAKFLRQKLKGLCGR